MKDVSFLVVVSAQEGLVTMRLTTPESVGETVRDNLEQSEEVAAQAQSWAAGAKPGDFCDCPCGWIFCVSGEATQVASTERAKARA